MLALLFLTQTVGLSPASWPPDVRARYEEMNRTYGKPVPLVERGTGMIGGTTGPIAVHAGYEALRAGGSAADAVITTALSEIVLSGGSWNSFAGVFYMVYFDAKTRKVYTVNAGYDTFKLERDPMTIPSAPKASGRTAMVPGFMAGVGEAHKRFGKLPLATLFQPAIYLAETGFEADAVTAYIVNAKKDVLARLPEAKAIFYKADGAPIAKGDRFQQTTLARTLKNIAREGTRYMYQGAWAEKFVELVRREGGKATLDDLKTYKPIVSEPIRLSFHGFELCALPQPEYGGINVLEGLAMADETGLTSGDTVSKSPEKMAKLIRIARYATMVTFMTKDKTSAAERLKPVEIKKNVARLADSDWEKKLIKGPSGGHSDSVVAVDAKGNVAAIVHSSNDILWGSTGIFVDGISIPDSASFQQSMLQRTKPGDRLPNATNPVIALKDGKPYLAAGCIGSALHECMLQCLINTLAFGMDPKNAVDSPMFWGVFSPETAKDWGDYGKQSIGPSVPREMVDSIVKLGQPVKTMTATEEMGVRSYWIGIRRTASGWQGGTSTGLNAFMEGW